MKIQTAFLTKRDDGSFEAVQHVNGPVPNINCDTRVLIDTKWYRVLWIETDIIDPDNVQQNVVVKFLRNYGTQS